jgi:single-strand DNA-binding protein
MASLNKVILIGTLGREPEVRYAPSGDAICNMSLATDDSFKAKDGEWRKVTDWHNLVAFRKLAEICGKHLRKGSLVYVEGRIKTETWEKDGKKHYATKIHVDEMKMMDKLEKKEPAEQRAPAPKSSQFDDLADDETF